MNRLPRLLAAMLIGVTALATGPATASAQPPAAAQQVVSQYIAANDGTPLFYKDWGPKDGPVVSFSHGWPLNSDSWESQMLFLAERGFRVIAHDRRGHGRSGQAWANNNMDQYADDLAAVLDALNVRDVTLVGFSTGGGEVTRYLGRHGSARVKRLVLVSAVTPIMVRNADNPNGVPLDVFDGLRKASLDNRAQLYRDIASGPFFGFNRAGAKVSPGLIESFWVQGMQASHKSTFDAIQAFSESNFVEDLKRVTVPTLVIHGDDDQIVPIQTSARATVKLVKGARLIEYAGGPHGITDTHKDRLNQDLLNFLK
ncbi:alpha/beta fold hydrolase [Roseateles cellulosilyticus]|uniref:Alpha/beta hydrolase n=1 Tax=Pelomonas cellulosilytica TaxID=2906762 RepID=A0ABS8XU39_9BURK|nr:alpha/beta hydrolase [Pelomonas sp. P8]MCE4554397.1 alpha/beta hydrolase [Pelomonas sp. P8]